MYSTKSLCHVFQVNTFLPKAFVTVFQTKKKLRHELPFSFSRYSSTLFSAFLLFFDVLILNFSSLGLWGQILSRTRVCLRVNVLVVLFLVHVGKKE